MKRRDFLSGLAVASASLAAGQTSKNPETAAAQSKPSQVPASGGGKNVIICARNGFNYIDAGYERLRQGADTLDAALTVVSGPENDPNDDSVGLGGLPNEDCVVELDSCCMHGPTRRAGSVGAVHDIKIKGVSGVDVLHMNGGTSNMQMGEIFKIRAGKIHEIETVGTSLPYGTKSDWE